MIHNMAVLRKKIIKSRQLLILFFIPLAYIIIFKYLPMYGAQIAFRDFMIRRGIWGSPWVGFDNFRRFFRSYQFIRVLRNTLGISLYSLIAGFPFPIILALSLNYLKNQRFKKTVQLVSYAPHFISIVVMVGIIMQFLAPRNGFLNNLISLLGGETIDFLARPPLFSTIYVVSGIWQNLGYSSIIYLGVLSAIDPILHEAAIVDGATKVQRIWHIDLPGIMPTAIILLIMNTGRILDVGFEKVLLLQNDLNLRASEVISTYVYKIGLIGTLPDYSYATAIGLFKSVIGMLLIISVNRVARRLGQTSLW